MVRGWLKRINAWWQQKEVASGELIAPSTLPRASAAPAPIGVERIVLTEGMADTLFGDYQRHCQSPRGEEEIGWVLLGLRQAEKAFVLAALPAGTQREAGVAHVRFNSDAQELASRILRQKDKRLGILGVVHTHPGSLRHPSEGDFQGDRRWVRQLRGGVGIFGIGTADARATESQNAPPEHRQYRGDLCFSWFALGQDDPEYRPVAVEIVSGLDLAQPVHAVWDTLETHTQPLNRLCRQLQRVQFEVNDREVEPSLIVHVGLAEPHQQLRLLLQGQEARYYWERRGELIAIDPREPQLDRAVYLILAELAKEPVLAPPASSMLVES